MRKTLQIIRIFGRQINFYINTYGINKFNRNWRSFKGRYGDSQGFAYFPLKCCSKSKIWFPDSDPLTRNVKEPALKGILKYSYSESYFENIPVQLLLKVNIKMFPASVLWRSMGLILKKLKNLICKLKLSKKIHIFLVVFYALVLIVQ